MASHFVLYREVVCALKREDHLRKSEFLLNIKSARVADLFLLENFMPNFGSMG